MAQDACLQTLSAWIIEYKRKTWIEHVKSNDDANELQAYKNTLEQQEALVRKAIYLEDTKKLQTLGWPEELMDCIRDMSIRPDIVDMLFQSLVTHHFNRSPRHEEELRNENSGLM